MGNPIELEGMLILSKKDSVAVISDC